ncbi:1,2-phenylacetyl-CoA epoxidase subunit PaaC [Piscinibacter sakaiensis]|uniref:1,2-phenylacetyl-CoA epoxidase subunit PaaC n=1 Tax=Piscinibacter sakaiensis TaxID=1547922 RepID=UPI003AAF59EA
MADAAAIDNGVRTAPPTPAPQVVYLLRLGDACLIHGQRLAEWCGHAPILEEDIALANIALDHIGQARALLTLAGQLEGRGRDEDALAYQRREAEFFNPTLLELPHAAAGSSEPCFARTMLRCYLWSSLAFLLWRALERSNQPTLAGIAAKAAKESRYHQRHAGDWVLRLGDGSDESHRRMQAALDSMWPYTAEWFSADAIDEQAAASGLGPAWSGLHADWTASVEPLLQQATLLRPADSAFLSSGKHGRHSEYMGRLLAEMQSVARAFPGAVW